MTPRQRVMAGIAGLVAAQALLYAGYRWHQRSKAPPPPGLVATTASGMAPTFDVENADGRIATLRWPSARPRLVHFWASWCEPCRLELPQLLALARDPALQGELEIIAIAIDDTWPAIRVLVGDPPVVIVRAVDPTTHRQFGIGTLPDTYLVAPSGALRARYAGAQPWQAATARTALAEHVRSLR